MTHDREHTTAPVPATTARRRAGRAGAFGAAGFTLLELMITVAIITILTLIAVPLYLNQVRESRRTDARTAALDLAGREERYFATNNAYTTTATDLGYASLPSNVGSGYYSINVSEPSGNQTFLVTVTPVAATSQAADTTCAQFTVDQLGQQAAQNSSGVDETSTCWP